MFGKTLYDIIGVSTDASQEEVRGAYRLRFKVMHPDRFDKSRQNKEWELANELLKELNHAYDILGNANLRRQYDRELGIADNSQSRSEDSKPTPSAPAEQVPEFVSGETQFDFLPSSIKLWLTTPHKHGAGHVFEIKTVWPCANYATVWAFLGSYIVFATFIQELSDTTMYWRGAITVFTAFIHGAFINWILRRHMAPVGCFALVTALYVVRVNFKRVQFWSLTELTEVKLEGTRSDVAHKLANGSPVAIEDFLFPASKVVLKFANHIETFSLRRGRSGKLFVNVLLESQQRLRDAIARRDLTYFQSGADFRGPKLQPISDSRKTPNKGGPAVIGYAVSVALWLILVWFIPNEEARTGRTTNSRGMSLQQLQDSLAERAKRRSSQQQPFHEPQQPTPMNGEIREFMNRPRIAPLEIKSEIGTNFLVKLVDKQSGQPALTVFVRGGATVNIDVPLGTYVVKYAAGERWFGYEHLFGPETSCSRADEPFSFTDTGGRLSGYTITLYKVSDGNLRTTAISKDAF